MSISPMRLITHTCLAVLVWLLLIPSASAQQPETIKIDGRDYVSTDWIKTFYAFQRVTRAGDKLTLENSRIRMELRLGGQECRMNNMLFVFSYNIIEQSGKAWISWIDLSKLVDPVLRPRYIQNAGNFQTVIIDPGHGGKDPGATNALGTEADYNLDTAKRVQKLLTASGYKVIMTRSDDHYLSLQERVDLANAVTQNAIFISIHHNSGNSAARGIETFTLSPTGVAHYGRDLKESDFKEVTGNSHDSANMALASSVHATVKTKLGTNTEDRGVKRARFSVLSGVTHPAILIECGFMTNPYEAKLINQDDYRNAVANGIAAAVVRYRAAVNQTPELSKP
jgi:N-acetylmuramoyl-L-alanine amidase